VVGEGSGDIEAAAWWSTMGTLVTATCANDIHELHVVGRAVVVLLIVMVRFEGRERRGGCVAGNEMERTFRRKPITQAGVQCSAN
jgi:hypothetical protein